MFPLCTSNCHKTIRALELWFRHRCQLLKQRSQELDSQWLPFPKHQITFWTSVISINLLRKMQTVNFQQDGGEMLWRGVLREWFLMQEAVEAVQTKWTFTVYWIKCQMTCKPSRPQAVLIKRRLALKISAISLSHLNDCNLVFSDFNWVAFQSDLWQRLCFPHLFIFFVSQWIALHSQVIAAPWDTLQEIDTIFNLLCSYLGGIYTWGRLMHPTGIWNETGRMIQGPKWK